MDLNTIWFLLVAVLITGYAILDGFDLGVGVIHLFTKDENEKRININAIADVKSLLAIPYCNAYFTFLSPIPPD